MEQQAIIQSIKERGYIGYDGRLWTKYSVCDLLALITGVHSLHTPDLVEQVQQAARLTDQQMQYGGAISIEQVEQIAACLTGPERSKYIP